MGNVSANTETTVCILNAGCSGETITVIPPHPVFSGLSGNTVTQMNLVQMGGENGVYS